MDAPAHFVPLSPPLLSPTESLSESTPDSLPSSSNDSNVTKEQAGYRLEVSDELLVDLHTRLFCTRFPDAVSPNESDLDPNHVGGLAHFRGLVQYWFEEFDWRVAESRLNAFTHHFAEIRGERMHYLYERSDREDSPHIVLLHDWPGSFHSLIPLVHALRPYFHVIVPALPGFAFSQASPNGGLDADSTAAALYELVFKHLGISRAFIHTGELGWNVTHRIALQHPESLFGVHLSAESLREISGEAPARAMLYAMQDSPIGLAAWMVQELGSRQVARIPRDEFLTELMIYWTSGSIASAIRARRELAPTTGLSLGDRAVVPTFVSASAELLRAARHRAKRDFTVVRAAELNGSGAFLDGDAALTLARELHQFALEALPRARRPGLKTARHVSSAPSAPYKNKPA